VARSNVRPAGPGETSRCFEIAERLPLYFSVSGLEILRGDLEAHDVVVADDDGSVVGFVTLNRKSTAVREISWLAVDPSVHSEGVGSQLIDEAEELCRGDGVSILEVKTLAEKDGASNYEGTRRFYERHGFSLLDVIDPFPGWDPGNPCAIYVKALR
jgi:GNAT superfamily N-acetyltransferase